MTPSTDNLILTFTDADYQDALMRRREAIDALRCAGFGPADIASVVRSVADPDHTRALLGKYEFENQKNLRQAKVDGVIRDFAEGHDPLDHKAAFPSPMPGLFVRFDWKSFVAVTIGTFLAGAVLVFVTRGIAAMIHHYGTPVPVVVGLILSAVVGGVFAFKDEADD